MATDTTMISAASASRVYGEFAPMPGTEATGLLLNRSTYECLDQVAGAFADQFITPALRAESVGEIARLVPADLSEFWGLLTTMSVLLRQLGVSTREVRAADRLSWLNEDEAAELEFVESTMRRAERVAKRLNEVLPNEMQFVGRYRWCTALYVIATSALVSVTAEERAKRTPILLEALRGAALLSYETVREAEVSRQTDSEPESGEVEQIPWDEEDAALAGSL